MAHMDGDTEQLVELPSWAQKSEAPPKKPKRLTLADRLRDVAGGEDVVIDLAELERLRPKD